ncbi:MAG: Transcriptional regulatory protein PmpR [Alphaproteobacteria bacterium MarineAlpha11_Bin1]|nr:MAG: Transcriptional regulatory protein PmpR [Alphaproteobacteria bacterium MarineAlpha11_Bin1]|tara:strand:+ start:8400 stop:9146 length:747 start_codon:yes stop_codon:yes gene_type:complete
MAGHSKFKNIQYRKGAQDAKRAKVFTKLIRELTVAAKGGADPDANPRLRAAISASKNANMGKDTMERAIARGSGNDEGDQYEEIRYEGYGPKGVAVIVEALTDNRNRTASDVRAAFTKFGGNLGETGSVNFMFDRVGQLFYTLNVADAETVFEAAIDAGAQEVETNEDGHEIICEPNDFNNVCEDLEGLFGPANSAELTWKAQTTVDLDIDSAKTMLNLLDALEDNDDVQKVSSNVEIQDAVMSELSD